MTILSQLREYILSCDLLTELEGATNVSVDFSNDSNIGTYCIEEGITQPIVKRYIDGSTMKQYLFNFSSINSYGQDIIQNIENCGFYEDFTSWLDFNNDNKILPTLSEDKEAMKVEALTNGYLFNESADTTSARYTIQLRLTYLQK